MKKALLIIDIQKDYFNSGRMPLVEADKATGNARIILNSFREENLPIIQIKYISTRPTATFLLPNTDGIDIHDNVRPKETEKIIV